MIATMLPVTKVTPRRLLRDRHERKVDDIRLTAGVYAMLSQSLQDARVPLDIGVLAVGMLLDELHDGQAALSLDWAISDTGQAPRADRADQFTQGEGRHKRRARRKDDRV